MKTLSQKQVWDNIAKEWYEFKNAPGCGVNEFLGEKKGKILDLGSGAGRNLIKVKDVEWHLVDFSEKMLKLAEKKAKKQKIKIKTTQAELTKLPFEKNFFDSAICIAALHCVEGEKNRKKSIKELFRVLKPSAEVLIAVWNKESKRFKNSPKEKYVNWRDKGLRYYYLYEEKELENLLKKTGFKTKEWIGSKANVVFIARKPAK